MPEARYFSMPSVEVGAELRRKRALNCWPWVRSLTHSPEAVTHSPAEIVAACPTVVTSSRCPRALTRRTQKPFSALWKGTRSTKPASTSCADKLGCGFSPPFTRRQTPCSQKFPKSIIITWSPSTRFRLSQGCTQCRKCCWRGHHGWPPALRRHSACSSICEIHADLLPGSRCHTVLLCPKRTRLPTMSTIELVDPELRDALALSPQVPLTAETLTRRRADALALLSSVPIPNLPDIKTGEIHVESAFGAKPIRVLTYRPVRSDDPLPVIVHVHGGGFVMGTPEMKDVENRLFASELKCAIYSVDYRLAPEAPHPAPLEDIDSVFVWLQANAGQLGLQPARIGIKGES